MIGKQRARIYSAGVFVPNALITVVINVIYLSTLPRHVLTLQVKRTQNLYCPNAVFLLYLYKVCRIYKPEKTDISERAFILLQFFFCLQRRTVTSLTGAATSRWTTAKSKHPYPRQHTAVSIPSFAANHRSTTT